jgi:hypothetical protein
LSLGQQQRVARALVRPSRLLLLDEPFSALDAPLRANLRQQTLAPQSESVPPRSSSRMIRPKLHCWLTNCWCLRADACSNRA